MFLVFLVITAERCMLPSSATGKNSYAITGVGGKILLHGPIARSQIFVEKGKEQRTGEQLINKAPPQTAWRSRLASFWENVHSSAN